MKITWFGAMTFRIQMSGRIVALEPDTALQAIDARELVSGADTIIRAHSADIDAFEPLAWRPRRRGRLIDETKEDGLSLYRLGVDGLVADSVDDGLLVIDNAAHQPQYGRWADGAVAVLAGTGAQCAANGTALLDIARPKLIALAVSEGDAGSLFDILMPHLGEASLIVLDVGLAVEV